MGVKRSNVNNTINIKSMPVQSHVGASKFINDDWGTIAFSIPRNQIQNKFVDIELRYNFIYFLFGYKGSKEVVYVGQAKKRNDGESVLKRLREHDKSTTERYKDAWSWIVAVTNKDDTWGLDDLNALEHAFYNEIPAGQNLNGNNPNSGGVNYDAYVDKINQIKSLITAVGFNIFSNDETSEKIQITSETNDYSIVEDLQNGMARIPEIVTPHKIVKTMVDMIPKEMWNSKTKFIDIACKGGEYLREIYDRLMETETLQAEFPNNIERSNHILKNQIYGIALSQVSLERTTKKLLGEDRNIRVIHNYIDILKLKDLPTMLGGSISSLNYVLNKEFGKNMKFDVVIGNPPYQESTGGGNGGSGVSIYPLFVENGTKLAKHTCMIIPARWMSDRPNGVDGDTLTRLRTRDDIQTIIDFKDKQVFNGVNIAGGVCILHINTELSGRRLDTHGVIIRDAMYRKIINKIVENNFTSLSDFIDSDCFRSGTHMNSGWLGFSNFPNNGFSIKYYCSDRDSLVGYGYVEPSDIIKNHSVVNEYKVALKSASPTDARVIYPGFVMEPNSCCSRTFIVIHGKSIIHSEEECNTILKYLYTKFARACIKSIKNTQNASAQAYKFVPLQDFTSKSDIDWSKSIDDIDKQLYLKYRLSNEEIDYIENNIKPIK